MRRLLLRLLLLAVCFHTVVGRPAHEASHVVQAIGQVAAQASTRVAFDQGVERVGGVEAEGLETIGDVGGGEGRADGLCAWCLAHAQFVAVLDVAWSAPLAASAAVRREPPLAIGFLPGLDRWRFSARDPPEATTRG